MLSDSRFLLIAIWIFVVAVRFGRSRVVLIGGLLAVGFYTVITLLRDDVSMQVL
jgi:hypothetical protein